ncbi:MAG: hypothetical protein ABSD71_13965 [Bacteroidales bacterium]|jgi:hypothetical protein
MKNTLSKSYKMEKNKKKEFGETPNTDNTTSLNGCSNVTENNSTGSLRTIATTVGEFSTGLVSDSNNGIPLEKLDWFLENLQETINVFESLTQGNVSYESNIMDLELTVNHFKEKLEWCIIELDKLFFRSGYEVTGHLMDLYDELMERSDDILSQFHSLQVENTIGFSEPLVKECLHSNQIDQIFCFEYLLKRKTKGNSHLKRFLTITLEYEPLLKLIEEKVREHKVTPKFINQMDRKVMKCHSQLIDLLIEVKTYLKNRKSDSNWRMYSSLVLNIDWSMSISDKLFNCILLPEEKGFETIEKDFLEILDYNEGLGYYDIDEIRDSVLND